MSICILVSLVAHRFGRVEFQIFVVVFTLEKMKTNIRDAKFETFKSMSYQGHWCPLFVHALSYCVLNVLYIRNFQARRHCPNDMRNAFGSRKLAYAWTTFLKTNF